MHWVKSDLLLYREVQCSPQSVQSPRGHSLFFWGFLKSSYQNISSCWSTAALKRDCGLLLGIEVQLIVFCTIIEVQVVFNEMLLMLVTGQLAIAGQLGKEVYLWSIRLLFESGRWRWLRGRVLSRWGHQRCVFLILRSHSNTRGESFSLLLGVRLKNLFLCLLCMVAFVVLFLVAVINGHR